MSGGFRRPVRVTAGFFEQLDAYLKTDRGPLGQPSATDFVAIELPPLIERFATGFDDLPEAIDGLSSARMAVVPGQLVYAIAAYGVLAQDGAIDLVALAIDVAGPSAND